MVLWKTTTNGPLCWMKLKEWKSWTVNQRRKIGVNFINVCDRVSRYAAGEKIVGTLVNLKKWTDADWNICRNKTFWEPNLNLNNVVENVIK